MPELDDWDKEQWKKAEEVSKEYKDEQIDDKFKLSSLIADLMIRYGPDGHCDGHEIMAEVIWSKLK